MIIEEQLENAIKSEIQALSVGAFLVTSRNPETEPENTDNCVAIAVGFRQHDNFDLSPITVNATIAVVSRVECDKDKTAHNQVVETIVNRLSYLHRNADAMTTAFSTDNFSAGCLYFSGGENTLDRTNQTWQQTINITIRGLEIFPT